MKKILIFGGFLALFAVCDAHPGVRDGTSSNVRAGNTTQSRTSTTVLRTNSENNRTANPGRTGKVVSRATTAPVRTTKVRTSVTSPTRVATTRVNDRTKTSRAAATKSRTAVALPRTAVSARAATENSSGMYETRTGAAYNQCKTAYFQCMDQFCQLKNDEYRRCSCSARIDDLMEARKNLTETNEKLTEFTENLDVVGLTAAQAKAIHTASDGENALTADMSASKALLTAIMNSIRGEDSTVSGKMSDLNSINLSFDTAIAFGAGDAGQIVASYNGTALYNAVYPNCRSAVAADCNDASLQRAVTAYLMAIEQDCNTVTTAIQNKQKDLRNAITESSAMLDLARVENRKKHNSDDLTTCVNNIESAVLSEQVCGAGYHKCLDNGEFIDITTGAPITGVVNFYELGNLLKFDPGHDAYDQKLSQYSDNRKFVKAFEEKTKKFAADALDRCVEIADKAWQQYLDKALLDIYYAQQSKVTTIKNGCFDLISQCYSEKEASITMAMTELIEGGAATLLQPDKIVLTTQMCTDYIQSCNNMFGEDIIVEYVDHQKDTDTLEACRSAAKECFDRFGGQNYENFYSPSSGLFETGMPDNMQIVAGNEFADFDTLSALDWFTLYERKTSGEIILENGKPKYKSKCAQMVADIDSCADKVETVFGGFDKIPAKRIPTLEEEGARYYQIGTEGTSQEAAYAAYGLCYDENDGKCDSDTHIKNRYLRSVGVATEVYNNIVNMLTTQCVNIQGKFVEPQFIKRKYYGLDPKDGTPDLGDANMLYTKNTLCHYNNTQTPSRTNNTLFKKYGIPIHHIYYENPNVDTDIKTYNCTGHPDNDAWYTGFQETDWMECKKYNQNAPEYMCPREYTINVDTDAWGICSCWENGGRRSKDGLISKCMPLIRVTTNEWYGEDVNVYRDDWWEPQAKPLGALDRKCTDYELETPVDASGATFYYLPMGVHIINQATSYNCLPSGTSDKPNIHCNTPSNHLSSYDTPFDAYYNPTDGQSNNYSISYWWHHLNDYYTKTPDEQLYFWCTANTNSNTGRVCPLDNQDDNCSIPDEVPN